MKKVATVSSELMAQMQNDIERDGFLRADNYPTDLFYEKPEVIDTTATPVEDTPLLLVEGKEQEATA